MMRTWKVLVLGLVWLILVAAGCRTGPAGAPEPGSPKERPTGVLWEYRRF